MSFDFDAAVQAPFRMQPGLRRMAPGSLQLTPLEPGSRHQREKLAVLSAYWQQALLAVTAFDAQPAQHALYRHAAAEHPQAWQWDGARATACWMGTSVDSAGRVEQTTPGTFGLGNEVQCCLEGLPPHWRMAALAGLAFAEDLAIVNGRDATVPWLAVTLPSHWAPETKIGRHFATIHAPVADNGVLLKAAEGLMSLVCADVRWERFVWNVTDQPRLHAHPDRIARERWQDTPMPNAWWRTEHQTFLPLPALQQAVFTIHVQVQPLADVTLNPQRARRLHAAVASMSPEVLAYRGLSRVRQPLLHWLQACADA